VVGDILYERVVGDVADDHDVLHGGEASSSGVEAL
jgi:hypothetical protein